MGTRWWKQLFKPENDEEKPQEEIVCQVRRKNVWGYNGRTTQMQVRSLMQMKAFGKAKQGLL